MGDKANISKLFDDLFSIKEMLSEVVNTAMEAANEAESFGGEVTRVITGQLRQGLIPSIQKYIDDANTPSSISTMTNFLDTVPLAWVRPGPEAARAGVPGQESQMGAEVPNQGGNPTAPQGAVDDLQEAPQDGTVAEAAGVNPTVPDGIMAESNILKKRVGSVYRENIRDNKVSELDSFAFADVKIGDDYLQDPGYQGEEEIYNGMLHEQTKVNAMKRLDEDILTGSVSISEKGDMSNWREVLNDVDYRINESRDEFDALAATMPGWKASQKPGRMQEGNYGGYSFAGGNGAASIDDIIKDF
jgi:hypothetical protein